MTTTSRAGWPFDVAARVRRQPAMRTAAREASSGMPCSGPTCARPRPARHVHQPPTGSPRGASLAAHFALLAGLVQNPQPVGPTFLLAARRLGMARSSIHRALRRYEFAYHVEHMSDRSKRGAMSESARNAIVEEYRGQVRYYRGLQRTPGSNWSDATVTRYLAPHRVDATERLHAVGVTREHAARLLDAAERVRPVKPRPPATIGEYMNQLLRGGQA
jgi:hypothetical protein